jgi:hypothetical protein
MIANWFKGSKSSGTKTNAKEFLPLIKTYIVRLNKFYSGLEFYYSFKNILIIEPLLIKDQDIKKLLSVRFRATG